MISPDHPDYPSFLKAIDEITQQKPVLVHADDLFDVVKPKTRAYTTVLEALDRFHAAGIHSPLHFQRLRNSMQMQADSHCMHHFF